MSLAINLDNVAAVLVGDEWIKVAEGSFDTDAFEFMHDGTLYWNGGTGFSFRPENETHLVAGPMSALQAVRYTT